jgi:hypothetical protein
VSFSNWLASLPHRHKLVIAGNHDITMDAAGFGRSLTHQKLLKAAMERDPPGSDIPAGAREKQLLTELPRRARALLSANCTYLQDEAVCVEGVRVYGSPWVPGASSWAFAYARCTGTIWSQVPADVDILLTHGPPAGLLFPDRAGGLTELRPDPGCEMLRAAAVRVAPVVHVCGHVHEHYGVYRQPIGPVVINAAVVDSRRPIVFDLRRKE